MKTHLFKKGGWSDINEKSVSEFVWLDLPLEECHFVFERRAEASIRWLGVEIKICIGLTYKENRIEISSECKTYPSPQNNR